MIMTHDVKTVLPAFVRTKYRLGEYRLTRVSNPV